jgi:hypothetical protein
MAYVGSSCLMTEEDKRLIFIVTAHSYIIPEGNRTQIYLSKSISYHLELVYHCQNIHYIS